MRRDEFALVDKVRKDDMEYLIKRFDRLMESSAMTDGVAMGISLCYGIVKEYQDKIGSGCNDN